MADLIEYAPIAAKEDGDGFFLEDHHNLRRNFEYVRQMRRGCRVNGSQSLVTGAFTRLDLDGAEDYDPHDMHSTTTNTHRLVATIPGKYLLLAECIFPANATGNRGLAIRNSVGLTEVCRAMHRNAGASDQTIVQVCCEEEIFQDNWVDLVGFQDSGGSLSVTYYMSMRWVSP